MTKIKIYTFAHNRPDFIKLQKKSFDRFLKDDYEFVVFNNEKPGSEGGFNPDRISEIEQTCDKLNIESIPVKLSEDLKYINGNMMFHGEKYLNGVNACAYSLSWAWKNYISKDNSISVVIDSDMFLFKKTSFIDMMNGYNFSYCPSYRDNFRIKYPWNGIIIADIPNMPNPEKMTWGPGMVNNIETDVGGELHHYLEHHKSELKTLYIDMWGLLDDRNTTKKEFCINGCAQYFIDDLTNKLYRTDPQALLPEENNKTFPHQMDRENYWNYFYEIYNNIKKFTQQFNFPKPTYIDFIKTEKENDIFNSFIIHYKSGSNYQPWANSEYNDEKTKIFQTLFKEDNL